MRNLWIFQTVKIFSADTKMGEGLLESLQKRVERNLSVEKIVHYISCI